MQPSYGLWLPQHQPAAPALVILALPVSKSKEVKNIPTRRPPHPIVSGDLPGSRSSPSTGYPWFIHFDRGAEF